MVRSGGVTYGHFLLTASTRVVRPSQEQLRVAVTLANQVGAALAMTDTGRAGPEGGVLIEDQPLPVRVDERFASAGGPRVS